MASRRKRKVFIVHGHDSQATAETASLVTKLGMDPVILSRDAGSGSPTIIEKLEQATDVSFAIVLLTPDDLGAAQGQTLSNPRARQNVVLELGYLFARLGRSRVICLTKGELELPSDIHGVVFHRFEKSVEELDATLAREFAELKKSPEDDRDIISCCQTLQSTSSPEFILCMRQCIDKARHIVVIATGINEPLMTVLMEAMPRVAKNQCDMELLVADPTSPAVQTRLIEEEMGEHKPTLGPEGLLRRLDALIRMWDKYGKPASLIIRLFSHYPSFAAIIVGRDYFFYPYGYTRLGTFSPVLRFSKDDKQARPFTAFLEDQYLRIKAASVKIERFAVQCSREDIVRGALWPLAVYFVPMESSELYRFGTRVLGYDIRHRSLVSSPWSHLAGDSPIFGFHLSISDALYFLSEVEVAGICREVEFFAHQLSPFPLTDLRLEAFPNASSLSLIPKDPTGSLEALHHELVFRVYRRAAASNYTLGIDVPARRELSLRDELMIQRYRAPYILGRFQPHFTLLTAIPAIDRERVAAEVKSAFAKEVCETSIRLDRLAIVTRPDPYSPWCIREEILL